MVLRFALALCLCFSSTVTMAHDMGNVAVAYTIVLAIPIPGLVVLMGWRKALICFIPVAMTSLAIANTGEYLLMYLVLLAPYPIWVLRTIVRRRKARSMIHK